MTPEPLSGVEFRRLRAGDIGMVLRMNDDFREGFAAREHAERFLADARNWLFAAIEGGRVIGFAYGYELTRLSGARAMLYVHEVGVTEGRQRRGVGSALMRALMDECRAADIGKLFLTAYRSNAGANALYRSLGGEVCAGSQGDDVVYWFRLG